MTASKPYPTAEALVRDAQMVFLTTPDSQIAEVCSCLSMQNAFLPGQIVLHTSGLLSSQILSPAKEAGCFIYSLHPLQAVTGGALGAQNLAGSFFTIEGDAEKMHVIEEIMQRCGASYRIIAKEYKPLYHAAACIASNYLVTIIDSAVSLLEKAGFLQEEGFHALTPLLEGTLTNIRSFGVEKALTGPIKRGDKDTVACHLSNLERFAPEELALYRVLGERTVSLVQKGEGWEKDSLEGLKKVLGGKENDKQV